MSWFIETTVSGRKLPPFFRHTLAFEIRGVREGIWESEEFKVMCYVIGTGKQPYLDNKLAKFAKHVLNAEFYNWKHSVFLEAKIYKEAVETEQISRDEISPAKLYRAYAEIDDEQVYAEDLY